MLSIHWGYFGSFDPLGNDFDAFNPLGILFDLLGIFLPFLDIFLNFRLHFWLLRNSMGIFEFLFLLNYMYFSKEA